MALLATTGLLAGVLYFGGRRAGHSHLSHTISELGKTGAMAARKVNLGLFLPVGLVLYGLAALAGPGTALRGLAVCGARATQWRPCFPATPGRRGRARGGSSCTTWVGSWGTLAARTF